MGMPWRTALRLAGRRLDSSQRHHLGEAERHARVHRRSALTQARARLHAQQVAALLVRPRPDPRATGATGGSLGGHRLRRQESRCRPRRGSVYGKAAGTNLAPTGTRHDKADHPNGRNPGDVWTITTQPFAEAHFAVMPQALAERAILAGCKPGGTVLDPFSGSGTTGLAAAKHGRRYVGIDLSADYLDLSLRTRLGQRGVGMTSAPRGYDGKTGAGRAKARPKAVRDVETLPCPRGGLHKLTNSAVRGGLVSACRCGKTWSELDAAERGRR
jgi:hypothetical protein